MPLYEYHCATCNHRFDKLQPMSATSAECPECEQPARRLLSVFASHSNKGEAGSADFSPMPPMSGGGCCGGGCGCGH